MAIEIRLLECDLEMPLCHFFEELCRHSVDQFFHPHPFTPNEAHLRASYEGEDLYYVLIDNDEILGYGMLRGWDEGYEVPSLGVVIHPNRQGRGLGKIMMNFLHVAAWWRNAKKVRLRVHPKNYKAVQLYQSLGYLFGPDKTGEYLEGFLDIDHT